MSDPRKATNETRLDPKDRSYAYDSTIVYDPTKAGGSVSVGLAVTLTGNKIVGLAADGDVIRGKLMKVESDGFCAVQCGGTNDFAPGTGAAVTVGKKAVGALLIAAKGYVREIASDAEAAKSRATIEGSEDATHIILDLG